MESYISSKRKRANPNPYEILSDELEKSAEGSLLEIWLEMVSRPISAVLRGRIIPFWLRATWLTVLVLFLDFSITLVVHKEILLQNIAEDCLWAGYTLLSILLLRRQFMIQVEILRRETLPAIEKECLPAIRKWMNSLTALVPQIGFTVFAGALGVFIVTSMSQSRTGALPAPGSIALYLMNFAHLGMLIYLAFPLISLYTHIGNAKLTLYEQNPSLSIVMTKMHKLIGNFSFTFAFTSTLLMILGLIVFRGARYLGTGIIVIAIFSWIPILVFFFNSQKAFAKIIQRSKNNTLSQLQARISDIEKKADLSNLETIELLQRLTEYHHQIAMTPDSMINLQTILGLLNSLILPLIGILIGNYERILNLLGIHLP